MADHGKIAGDKDLPRLIQDNLRQADNRRHLRRMAIFRPAIGADARFDDLLARLDIAEAMRKQ